MRSWYTPDSEHLHYRFAGPLLPILELATQMHERTPMLERLYYPQFDEGILLTAIDRQAESRLFRLKHNSGCPELKHRVNPLPELFKGRGATQPFRLTDMALSPYQGEIGTPGFRFTPDTGALRYYRFVDTPTAEIARQLAPYFPVYCFAVYAAQFTYVGMTSQRFRDIRPAIRHAFPGLVVSIRFDLPYESTSHHSPIQRPYHHPSYF